MVYTMILYVDGGCRRNGYGDAVGAAAAILKQRWGKYKYKTQGLCSGSRPTNQRAEITAVILGLELALERYMELRSTPDLRVTIYSDSKYAIGCMTEWIYKWCTNGWTNARGAEVANQDLIKEASHLDDRLAALGSVKYVWIPRSENEIADKHCNEKLDEMEWLDSGEEWTC